MKLYCFFIQREERYSGQHAPELGVAVDEYTMDENPRYFPEECDKVLKTVSSEVIGKAVIILEVDQDAIRQACLGSTTLKAKIVPPDSI